MHSAFQRMAQSVLAALGEDAFLRGTVPCRVNIEHGVQVSDNDLIYDRSIATISKAVSPARGDALQHPDGSYTLDRLYQDNGANTRWIILPVGN